MTRKVRPTESSDKASSPSPELAYLTKPYFTHRGRQLYQPAEPNDGRGGDRVAAYRARALKWELDLAAAELEDAGTSSERRSELREWVAGIASRRAPSDAQVRLELMRAINFGVATAARERVPMAEEFARQAFAWTFHELARELAMGELQVATDAWTRGPGRPAPGSVSKWTAVNRIAVRLGCAHVTDDALERQWRDWIAENPADGAP